MPSRFTGTTSYLPLDRINMFRLSGFALAAASLFGLALGSVETFIDSWKKVGDELPDRYVVVLKPNLDMEPHLSWVRSIGSTNVNSLGELRYPGVEKTYKGNYGRRQAFRAYAGSFDGTAIEKIENHPDVSTAELRPVI